MKPITIAPVQWSSLKDIDDIEPLNDADADCLAEVREILKKHGKMDRFGIALLHSHFEIESDEIMLESSDAESRTLVTKPVKQADAGTSNVGTIWMLCDGDVITMARCRVYCEKQPWPFGHAQNHRPGR